MNVALRRRTMTEAEFLAWVEPLERRYEYDGTGPVAMVGSTLAHGLIQVNLLAALHRCLSGSRYITVGSDNFTRVSGSLRLPDAVVLRRDGLRSRSRVIADAIAVFEILSDSTAHIDRFDKAREYRATPSIQHYVMLDQDRIGAIVLSRGGELWTRIEVARGETIELPAIGVILPVDELYGGLDLPEVPADVADPE